MIFIIIIVFFGLIFVSNSYIITIVEHITPFAKMTDGKEVQTPLSRGDAALESLGRGRFMSRVEYTPVKGAGALGKPVLSSTHLHTDAHSPAPHMHRFEDASDIGSGVSPVGCPVFSHTHTHTDEHSPRQPVCSPEASSPDLGNLITRLAYEIR